MFKIRSNREHSHAVLDSLTSTCSGSKAIRHWPSNTTSRPGHLHTPSSTENPHPTPCPLRVHFSQCSWQLQPFLSPSINHCHNFPFPPSTELPSHGCPWKSASERVLLLERLCSSPIVTAGCHCITNAVLRNIIFPLGWSSTAEGATPNYQCLVLVFQGKPWTGISCDSRGWGTSSITSARGIRAFHAQGKMSAVASKFPFSPATLQNICLQMCFVSQLHTHNPRAKKGSWICDHINRAPLQQHNPQWPFRNDGISQPVHRKLTRNPWRGRLPSQLPQNNTLSNIWWRLLQA